MSEEKGEGLPVCVIRINLMGSGLKRPPRRAGERESEYLARAGRLMAASTGPAMLDCGEEGEGWDLAREVVAGPEPAEAEPQGRRRSGWYGI